MTVGINLGSNKSHKIRPDGEDKELRDYKRQIASILGIEPSLNTDSDFIKMSNEMVEDSNNNQVTCLQEDDSDVKVDEKICRWCERNNLCKMNSIIDSGKRIEVTINGSAGLESDYQILVKFIENSEFTSSVFPWKDPFQISWASRGSRTILAEPVNLRIFQPSSSGISPWGSLYYCPALQRQVTLFEAQVIEGIQQIADTNTWDLQRGDELLTGKQFVSWMEGLDISFTDATSFRNDLQAKGLLRVIKNLVDFTAQNHTSGLYAVGTEISSHQHKESDEMMDDATEFLYSIAHSLKSRIEELGQYPVLQTRIDTILLIPENAKSVLIKSNGFRIMRSIVLPGLSRPWALMDIDMDEHLPYTIDSKTDSVNTLITLQETSELGVIASQHILEREFIRIGGLDIVPYNETIASKVRRILAKSERLRKRWQRSGDHKEHFETKLTNIKTLAAQGEWEDAMQMIIEIKRELDEAFTISKNHTILQIPSERWLSANSVQRIFREHASASFGPSFYKSWNEFRKFLSQHGPLRNDAALRTAFSDPLIKKLTPYGALKQLYSDGRIHPIRYELREPDMELIQHEAFHIPVANGTLVVGRNRHMGKKKHIVDGIERSLSEFIVTAHGNLSPRHTAPLLISLNWREGEEVDDDLRKIKDVTLDLDECQGAIWCSEKVQVALDITQSPKAKWLAKKMVRMVHSMGKQNCLCFAFLDELEEGAHPLFQSADHESVHVCYLSESSEEQSTGWERLDECPVCKFPDWLASDISSSTIILWKPALAASEFSPQFVFLGGFGG